MISSIPARDRTARGSARVPILPRRTRRSCCGARGACIRRDETHDPDDHPRHCRRPLSRLVDGPPGFAGLACVPRRLRLLPPSRSRVWIGGSNCDRSDNGYRPSSDWTGAAGPVRFSPCAPSDHIAVCYSCRRCRHGGGGGAGTHHRYRRGLAHSFHRGFRDPDRPCQLAIAGGRPAIFWRTTAASDLPIGGVSRSPEIFRHRRPGHMTPSGCGPYQPGLSGCAICRQAADAGPALPQRRLPDFLPPACRRSSRDKKDGPRRPSLRFGPGGCSTGPLPAADAHRGRAGAARPQGKDKHHGQNRHVQEGLR
ncbi:hypothetical protein FG91_00862 [Sphingopyxis sp. LC81]|nr:hypothetical protein FG91_00862 [Sphingopyxis sp. LC81]